MPDSQLDLTLVVVNWNTRDLTLQTVRSVYDNPPGDFSFEIIVIDNHSADGSVEALLQEFPNANIIANADNRGFGPASNQGLKIARGRYSVLLNSDTIVQPGSLAKIIEFMDASPRVGLCGIRILNPDGSFQGSYASYLNLGQEVAILTGLGRKLRNREYPSQADEASRRSKPVDTIMGAFMFARTAALHDIGWMDESFFMYGEENDLSRRMARAGWQTYYLADVTIVHLGGQSSKKRFSRMAWQLQKSKHLIFQKYSGTVPAFAFKVMVSTAALAKMGLLQVHRLRGTNPERQNWASWSEFKQFWAN